MRLGSTWMTVTGMDTPSSEKTRVMPHLRPITPILIFVVLVSRHRLRLAGAAKALQIKGPPEYPAGRREPGIIPAWTAPATGLKGSFGCPRGLDGAQKGSWAPGRPLRGREGSQLGDGKPVLGLDSRAVQAPKNCPRESPTWCP